MGRATVLLLFTLTTAVVPRPTAPAATTIDVGTVRIQLCTADIVRVQAAGPPAPPPSPPPAPQPPPPGLVVVAGEYSGKKLDNAICGGGKNRGCPDNVARGRGYRFVRDVAALAADEKDCAAHYPAGHCQPLYYFYSPANNDNTIARNITQRPGYTRVTGGEAGNSTRSTVAGWVSDVVHSGLAPLKLWWCEVRKDYQVTGTVAGEKDVAKWCVGEGGRSSPETPYTLVETLGWAPLATAAAEEEAAAAAKGEGGDGEEAKETGQQRHERAVGNRSSLVVVNEWGAGAPVEHTVTRRPGGDTVIRTAALEVVVSAAATVPGNGSGGAAAAAAVSFFNASTGEALLAEIGREFTESAVTQSWDSPSTESLYGLGHYNFGILDFRLAPVDMTQWNLWKVVPFMVSTRGWGLLWDTSYATAHLNPVQDSESVQLGAWVVRPALPTDPAPTRAYNSSAAQWSEATGTVTVTAAGPHWVYAQLPTLIWCSHAARVKVGNVTVIDLFDDPCNLPPSTLERVMLEPGEHVVTVQSWAQSENKLQPRVWVRGEAAFGNRTRWQSDRPAASTDYYFMAGGSISRSIGLYRQATGAAPMPPRAIFGFMHSKDRFKNQTSLLAAAGGFRAGGYPIDTIVQDWYFWPKLQNSFQNHGFDPTRYPDPAQMTAQLKDTLNLHFMVTYWPKVDGPLRQELADQTPPALIGSVCDQYNPAGRELYYGYANTTKYAMGVDFSWLDSCDCQPSGRNFLGAGADYAMTYGLMEATAIHDGYIRDWGETRRMFALPRSSFAGMQRTGASMWSGDISGTWDSLRRSVAGSINYQLAGNALWSCDTGGYFHALDELSNTNYRELLVRWHQFSAFTPVLRQHGRKGAQTTPAGGSEYYLFGGNTTQAIKAAHQLRYRMLPYIYSVFATQVVRGAHLILQRALVMEFPDDQAVRQTADAFMFGSSFLVFPVLKFAESSHQCYMPQQGSEAGLRGSFIDFWTGEAHQAGTTVSVAVSLNHVPVFVRSGSIVPLGPHLHYASEKPSDPLELRVYRGADASFVLYEDDGKTMHYARRNQSTTVAMCWKEATTTLRIGARVGSFPTMLQTRTLHIVLVREGFGVGMEPTQEPSKTIAYTGDALTVQL